MNGAIGNLSLLASMGFIGQNTERQRWESVKLPHGLIWLLHLNGHPKERPELDPGRRFLVSSCFEMKREALGALNNGTCRTSTVGGEEGT